MDNCSTLFRENSHEAVYYSIHPGSTDAVVPMDAAALWWEMVGILNPLAASVNQALQLGKVL